MRVKAAETLSGIGAPAMATAPILLERLAQKPATDDPRGMEQRYLCFNVFGKMLKNSLAGVDQALLRKAVVAGLQNQDGRARGEIGGVYQFEAASSATSKSRRRITRSYPELN